MKTQISKKLLDLIKTKICKLTKIMKGSKMKHIKFENLLITCIQTFKHF